MTMKYESLYVIFHLYDRGVKSLINNYYPKKYRQQGQNQGGMIDNICINLFLETVVFRNDCVDSFIFLETSVVGNHCFCEMKCY